VTVSEWASKRVGECAEMLKFLEVARDNYELRITNYELAERMRI